MTWRGMDTESVQSLSSDLRDAGARGARSSRARLEGRLVGTEWIGQDATRFREDWQTRLRPTLEQAHGALGSAPRSRTATSATRRAASG